MGGARVGTPSQKTESTTWDALSRRPVLSSGVPFYPFGCPQWLPVTGNKKDIPFAKSVGRISSLRSCSEQSELLCADDHSLRGHLNSLGNS